MTEMISADDKTFLGADFLTWLMCKSMSEKDRIKLEGIDPFELLFERNITFGSEWEKKEKTVIKGEYPGLQWGAAIAIAESKKVEKANLRFAFRDQVWKVSVTAETLGFSSFKTTLPRQHFPEDIIITRMAAWEMFRQFFEKIYTAFVEIRCNQHKWNNEMKKIHEMISDVLKEVNE